MAVELVKTNHVLCPDCNEPTYGPYFDPASGEYFDGFYCEDCGRTWHWDDKAKRFVKSFL